MRILDCFQIRRAKRVAKSGIGAFSPNALKSFLEGICTRCLSPIPDLTLFGNALVVTHGTASFLCSACRKLPEPLPKVNAFRTGVDRAKVLLSLKHFRAVFNLKDIEIVLALRSNYSDFDLPRIRERAFDTLPWIFKDGPSPYFQYGDLFSIGSCGECKAWWPRGQRDIEEYRSGRKLLDRNHRWRDGYCWACGCPDHAQWHIRATLEQEVAWLAAWQTVPNVDT